ncbi:MerR family transcriptional regulator [Cumulibacter soli]|uniref:MerR family transcriptional regulator n=1 Tax=Cumulibacter soli TaxID=2546344 RepID=UPI00106775D1|nr:MerR family transcriptional regulator [Cumulibacter soli]
MLSIGDFARLAGVSVRMLRHYDQLGLLTPAQVDPFTGYRRYTADQLPRANQLVALKDLGFRLEDVGALLDGNAKSRVGTLLRQRRAELAAQLAADHARLRVIEARLRLMEEDQTMPETTFVEQTLPALRLVQISVRITDMSQVEPEIGPMFDRVNAAIDAMGAHRTGPGVAHYLGDEDGMVAAAAEQIAGDGVPDGLEAYELAAVPRAVVSTYESPDLLGIQAAWQGLVSEVQRRGLQPTGACREIYLRTPYESDRWEISLQQPVR